MTDFALLGPQYRMPNLRACLEGLGVRRSETVARVRTSRAAVRRMYQA